MMKYLKYVVIVSLSLTGLSGATPVFAEDVKSLAEEENSVFVDAMLNEEVYSVEKLHETFGEPNSEEELDDSTSRQFFNLEREDEATSLEVIADISTEEDEEVINLTFNIDFEDVVYEDSDAFSDTYSELVDYALELYKEGTVIERKQVVETLGDPTTITLAGSYELLVYSVGDSDSSTDYIVVLLDDKVYALNEHSNADGNLEKDFDITPSQLNQLSHTSGVTYNEMVDQIGQPDSIYHDFPNSVITYVWYSDTDEDFSEISYITDFRDIMVGIGHQLQGE